jgi:hypothetical protein
VPGGWTGTWGRCWRPRAARPRRAAPPPAGVRTRAAPGLREERVGREGGGGAAADGTSARRAGVGAARAPSGSGSRGPAFTPRGAAFTARRHARPPAGRAVAPPSPPRPGASARRQQPLGRRGRRGRGASGPRAGHWPCTPRPPARSPRPPPTSHSPRHCFRAAMEQARVRAARRRGVRRVPGAWPGFLPRLARGS